MKQSIFKTIAFFSILALTACQFKTDKKAIEPVQTSEAIEKTEEKAGLVSQDMATKVQDSLEALAEIRENFNRINAIKKWTDIKTGEALGSSEGGEATFYYEGKTLEKITAKYLMEMGNTTTEYYLMNGELSFVFEKMERYNSPYYITEKAEDLDAVEVFDPTKSEFVETRSYFEKGILFKSINTEKDQTALTSEALKTEQEYILEEFESLLSIEKY